MYTTICLTKDGKLDYTWSGYDVSLVSKNSSESTSPRDKIVIITSFMWRDTIDKDVEMGLAIGVVDN